MTLCEDKVKAERAGGVESCEPLPDLTTMMRGIRRSQAVGNVTVPLSDAVDAVRKETAESTS